jgi:hypothetical protein
LLRQQGEEQRAFRLALQHLRTNQITLQDWKLPFSRIKSKLVTAQHNLSEFDDAIHIYAKKMRLRLTTTNA